MAGLLFPGILAAVLAMLLLAGVGAAGRPRLPARGGPAWLWIAVGVLLVTDAYASLSTEFFTDSVAYHLALPERFLAVHRFTVMPGNMLNFLPLNTEMLYLPCLAFGGEEAAKVLNLALGMSVVASVASLARRIGGEGAGWAGGVAAFLAVSMPIFSVENEITFSDNSRALWELLALNWFIVSGAGSGRFLARGPLVLSAVFAGLAMGSKYLSFIECAVLSAILFVEVARRVEWRLGRALHAPLLYGFLALAVCSPWLVRNALATRDPVYPFGHKVFNSLRWSHFEQVRWTNDNRFYGVKDQTLLRWITLPVRVSMDRVVAEFGTFTTGPLLLGLAVLLLLRSSWPWAARVVLLLFLGEALVWSVTSHLLRYLYPGLMFVCALIGWVTDQAREKAGRSILAITLAMAVWAGCALVHRVHHRINIGEDNGLIASFTGKMSREDVLDRRGFGRRMARMPAGKILLVGEDRPLGIGRVWEGSSIYNVPLLEWWLKESPSVRRLSIRVRQAGIRSVLVNYSGFDSMKSRGDFDLTFSQMGILNAWWKTLGVVFTEPPVVGYAVPPFSRSDGRRP